MERLGHSQDAVSEAKVDEDEVSLLLERLLHDDHVLLDPGSFAGGGEGESHIVLQ